MFTTYRAAEMHFDLSPENADKQVWSFVEQEIIWPWFYVEIVRGIGDDEYCSMLMIPHARDLQRLLKKPSEVLRVESISLVSPPHINGRQEWSLEPLLELSSICYEDTEELGFMYVVAGGETYTAARTGRMEKYREIDKIFSAQRSS
ncbi:hypothetical protein [Pseudomonas sichuanensis]|uniref:hypothetical protein n=1 Tax=Pseudomonas TaxID=286 RepID=UPI002B4075B4|nr:hypothetical protein [Pseudomonas sichuanensis]